MNLSNLISKATYPTALSLLFIIQTGCPSPRWNIIEEETIELGEDGVYHTVKRGENLFRIAKTYNIDLQELAEVNDITDISKIKEGQRIFIPGARETREVEIPVNLGQQRGSEEGEKKRKKRENDTALTRGVAEGTAEEIKTFKGRFIWPVKGKVTSYFGVRSGRMHKGIDIAAPEGTRIVAAESGRVIYSDNKLRNYGNVIIIRHPGDYITVYAHNKVNYVKENQDVKKGEYIGEIGKTGNAEAPHLHFEIRENTKARNPLFYLP